MADERIEFIEENLEWPEEQPEGSYEAEAIQAFFKRYGKRYDIFKPVQGRLKKTFIAKAHDEGGRSIFFSVSRAEGTSDRVREEYLNEFQNNCRKAGVNGPWVLGSEILPESKNLITFQEYIDGGFHIFKFTPEEARLIGCEMGKLQGVTVRLDLEDYSITGKHADTVLDLKECLRKGSLGDFDRVAENIIRDRTLLKLPKGMIHDDIRPYNIVWTGVRADLENGKIEIRDARPNIIDFDCLRMGVPVEEAIEFERANIFNGAASTPEMLETSCAFYKGYAQGRKLADTEKEYILASVEKHFLLKTIELKRKPSSQDLSMLDTRLAGLRDAFYPEMAAKKKKELSIAGLGLALRGPRS